MSRKQRSSISSSHIKRKSEDDDLVIVKPDYDEDCYGLIQEVSMLEHNQRSGMARVL